MGAARNGVAKRACPIVAKLVEHLEAMSSIGDAMEEARDRMRKLEQAYLAEDGACKGLVEAIGIGDASAPDSLRAMVAQNYQDIAATLKQRSIEIS